MDKSEIGSIHITSGLSQGFFPGDHQLFQQHMFPNSLHFQQNPGGDFN